LNFAAAGAIIAPISASADTGVKDSCRGASTRDPPVQVETSPALEAGILQVGLVSGHTRTIDRGTVCSLLIGCLKDVSPIAFMVLLLFIFVWLLTFDCSCARLFL
jgi:hypothetical protein